MPPKTYKGSCHCSRVTFELDAKVDYAVYCNCSICRRRGALWATATDSTLRAVDALQHGASCEIRVHGGSLRCTQ